MHEQWQNYLVWVRERGLVWPKFRGSTYDSSYPLRRKRQLQALFGTYGHSQMAPLTAGDRGLLQKMTAAMSLSAGDFLICDTDDDFDRAMQTHDPRVIVTMGETALRQTCGPNLNLKADHGRWFQYRGRKVLPTFHPKQLREDPKLKRHAWNDLKIVMNFLGTAAHAV